MQKEHGNSPIMILDSLISRVQGNTLWEKGGCLTEDSLKAVLRKVELNRIKTPQEEYIAKVTSIATQSDELF